MIELPLSMVVDRAEIDRPRRTTMLGGPYKKYTRYQLKVMTTSGVIDHCLMKIFRVTVIIRNKKKVLSFVQVYNEQIISIFTIAKQKTMM